MSNNVGAYNYAGFSLHQKAAHFFIIVACLYIAAGFLGAVHLDAELLFTTAAVVCSYFYIVNLCVWGVSLKHCHIPWLQNTAGLFPLVLGIFFIRTLLYEPFFVPSESMEPTMEKGDVILVNKWTYGVRVPVINKWLVGPTLERGQPVVFRFPPSPSMYFVKRAIALEGDTIVVQGKNVWVNGQLLKEGSYRAQYSGGQDLEIEPDPFLIQSWPYNCVHAGDTIACRVPTGHFFAMGDNRDYSMDSRYWGFVPYGNLIGQAERYVFNVHSLKKREPVSMIR